MAWRPGRVPVQLALSWRAWYSLSAYVTLCAIRKSSSLSCWIGVWFWTDHRSLDRTFKARLLPAAFVAAQMRSFVRGNRRGALRVGFELGHVHAE